MFTVISTDESPSAIGPYSQAIEVVPKKMVFTSGQIPLDPKSMKVVSEDVIKQTDQVMRNLGGILRKAGCTFENVVKTTIFIKDMDDFAQINKAYESHLGSHRPARSTVEVSRLPKDVKVEIEAIAVKP